MINLQNKNGFSLLEVIVAMTIIAFMVSPLVIMASTILRRIVRDSRNEERIFLMRNLLCEVHRDQPPNTPTFEKRVGNTQLRYQLIPPPANSSLQPMKGIHIERVTATWYEAGKQAQDVLISTKYIEPEEPKAQS